MLSFSCTNLADDLTALPTDDFDKHNPMEHLRGIYSISATNSYQTLKSYFGFSYWIKFSFV